MRKVILSPTLLNQPEQCRPGLQVCLSFVFTTRAVSTHQAWRDAAEESGYIIPPVQDRTSGLADDAFIYSKHWSVGGGGGAGGRRRTFWILRKQGAAPDKCELLKYCHGCSFRTHLAAASELISHSQPLHRDGRSMIS